METVPDVVLCPRCGAENTARARFCSRCWGLLHGQVCPHCGKQATRAGARFCEHCDRDLFVEPSTAAPVQPPPVPPTPDPQQSGSPVSDSGPLVEPSAPVQESEEPVPTAPGPMAAEPSAVAPAVAEPPVIEPGPEQATGEQPIAEPAAQMHAIDPDKFVVMSDPAAALPTRRPIWQFAAAGVVVLIIALTIFAASATRRPDAGTGKRTTGPSPRPTNLVQPAGASSQPSASPSEASKPPAPSVGILKITTSPSGAQVELDGTTVGVTEVTLIDVKPGKHTLKVNKAGFKPISRDLDLAAGDTVVLDIPLSAAPPPAPRRRGPAAPPLPQPPPPPPPP